MGRGLFIMNVFKVVLHLCLLVFHNAILSGQDKSINWRTFTEQDGLNLKTTYSISEDKDGFIWVGTGDGLYRYDGHKFISFSSPLDKGNKTISSVLLKTFYDSTYNRLWLASLYDVQYLDLNDYTFYSWQSSNEGYNLSQSEFKHFIKTDDHTMWLSNGSSLYRHNIKKNIWKDITNDISFPADCNKSYFKFFNFDKNHIGVVTANYLFVVDTRSNAIVHTIRQEGGEIFQSGYYDKMEDKIYIPAIINLVSYDIKSKKKTSYQMQYKTTKGASLNYIINFIVPKDDKFFLLDFGNLMFDKTSNRLVTSFKENSNKSIITINGIHKDKKGNIWYTSYNDFCGVWYVDERNITNSGYIQNDKGINIEPYHTYPLNDSTYLFCGSGMNGIGLINPHSGQWKIINNIHNPSEFVYDITLSKNGEIWTLTPTGIYSFDLKSNKFIPFDFIENEKSGKYVDGYQMQLLNDSLLIISGSRYLGAINIFTRQLKSIFRANTSNKDKLGDIVTLGSDNEFVYFSTNQGMYRMDKKLSFKSFNIPIAKNNGQRCHQAIDMEVDDENNLWFSTFTSGLYKYNPRSGEVFNLQKTNSGFKSNNIDHLVMGEKDHLYVSSGQNIYIIDTKKEKVISKVDYYSAVKGGGYGFYKGYDRKKIAFNYYPYVIFKKLADTSNSEYPSKVTLLTSLTINGREVVKAPRMGMTLTLTHQENNLCFSFATLPITNGSATIYRYRLDDDEDWQETDQNIICLQRMSSGKYKIEVQSNIGPGYWNEDSLKIVIFIKPIFYKSWWFITSAILLFSLVVYKLYKKRIAKIEKEESSKSEIKKQMAELEMKALRAQMNPHFIFNSLNSIQKFIFDKDEYAASQYLTKFSRLIRLILEQSDQNFTTISSELELIKLYVEMESLRFGQSFTYEIGVDPSIDKESVIPSMIIQPHIENAIWHGILHLPKASEDPDFRVGLLSLYIHDEGNLISIKIKDNGVGRAKASEYKSKQLLKKKSYGTNITADRIRIYNEWKGVNTRVETQDLYDKNGRPNGTLVTIILPKEKTN